MAPKSSAPDIKALELLDLGDEVVKAEAEASMEARRILIVDDFMVNSNFDR
jgi:hypothetical protein